MQPVKQQGSSSLPMQRVSVVGAQGSAVSLRKSTGQTPSTRTAIQAPAPVHQASPLRSVGHEPSSFQSRMSNVSTLSTTSCVSSSPAVQSQASLFVPPVQLPREALGNLSPAVSYMQQSCEDTYRDDPQLQNLQELRRSSGLRKVPVRSALEAMYQNGKEGILTRDRFLCAYDDLLKAQGLEPPSDAICHGVFDLFDRDGNGAVDMMEIISGVSLLCEGSEDDKVHAVFEIFDRDGDGFISMEEMYVFLSSVFKVVLTPKVMEVMHSMGVACDSADDIASVTALECFRTADLNNDGKLSVGEFKDWFYAPRSDPAFLDSPVHKLLA
eukprot:TRINITY_DN1614_c0_g2_i1.p1 TRINITY_DN1614_c0_g2~~TRINITY_DN1614_c0_g2_i1.p1  ORF type:complete len:352 (-),score=58.29 TRINITY_DN1614_c0_g2_i1:131-1108(-)